MSSISFLCTYCTYFTQHSILPIGVKKNICHKYYQKITLLQRLRQFSYVISCRIHQKHGESIKKTFKTLDIYSKTLLKILSSFLEKWNFKKLEKVKMKVCHCPQQHLFKKALDHKFPHQLYIMFMMVSNAVL